MSRRLTVLKQKDLKAPVLRKEIIRVYITNKSSPCPAVTGVRSSKRNSVVGSSKFRAVRIKRHTKKSTQAKVVDEERRRTFLRPQLDLLRNLKEAYLQKISEKDIKPVATQDDTFNISPASLGSMDSSTKTPKSMESSTKPVSDPITSALPVCSYKSNDKRQVVIKQRYVKDTSSNLYPPDISNINVGNPENVKNQTCFNSRVNPSPLLIYSSSEMFNLNNVAAKLNPLGTHIKDFEAKIPAHAVISKIGNILEHAGPGKCSNDSVKNVIHGNEIPKKSFRHTPVAEIYMQPIPLPTLNDVSNKVALTYDVVDNILYQLPCPEQHAISNVSESNYVPPLFRLPVISNVQSLSEDWESVDSAAPVGTFCSNLPSTHDKDIDQSMPDKETKSSKEVENTYNRKNPGDPFGSSTKFISILKDKKEMPIVSSSRNYNSENSHVLIELPKKLENMQKGQNSNSTHNSSPKLRPLAIRKPKHLLKEKKSTHNTSSTKTFMPSATSSHKYDVDISRSVLYKGSNTHTPVKNLEKSQDPKDTFCSSSKSSSPLKVIVGDKVVQYEVDDSELSISLFSGSSNSINDIRDDNQFGKKAVVNSTELTTKTKTNTYAENNTINDTQIENNTIINDTQMENRKASLEPLEKMSTFIALSSDDIIVDLPPFFCPKNSPSMDRLYDIAPRTSIGSTGKYTRKTYQSNGCARTGISLLEMRSQILKNKAISAKKKITKSVCKKITGLQEEAKRNLRLSPKVQAKVTSGTITKPLVSRGSFTQEIDKSKTGTVENTCSVIGPNENSNANAPIVTKKSVDSIRKTTDKVESKIISQGSAEHAAIGKHEIGNPITKEDRINIDTAATENSTHSVLKHLLKSKKTSDQITPIIPDNSAKPVFNISCNTIRTEYSIDPNRYKKSSVEIIYNYLDEADKPMRDLSSNNVTSEHTLELTNAEKEPFKKILSKPNFETSNTLDVVYNDIATVVSAENNAEYIDIGQSKINRNDIKELVIADTITEKLLNSRESGKAKMNIKQHKKPAVRSGVDNRTTSEKKTVKVAPKIFDKPSGSFCNTKRSTEIINTNQDHANKQNRSAIDVNESCNIVSCTNVIANIAAENESALSDLQGFEESTKSSFKPSIDILGKESMITKTKTVHPNLTSSISNLTEDNSVLNKKVEMLAIPQKTSDHRGLELLSHLVFYPNIQKTDFDGIGQSEKTSTLPLVANQDVLADIFTPEDKRSQTGHVNAEKKCVVSTPSSENSLGSFENAQSKTNIEINNTSNSVNFETANLEPNDGSTVISECELHVTGMEDLAIAGIISTENDNMKINTSTNGMAENIADKTTLKTPDESSESPVYNKESLDDSIHVYNKNYSIEINICSNISNTPEAEPMLNSVNLETPLGVISNDGSNVDIVANSNVYTDVVTETETSKTDFNMANSSAKENKTATSKSVTPIQTNLCTLNKNENVEEPVLHETSLSERVELISNFDLGVSTQTENYQSGTDPPLSALPFEPSKNVRNYITAANDQSVKKNHSPAKSNMYSIITENLKRIIETDNVSNITSCEVKNTEHQECNLESSPDCRTTFEITVDETHAENSTLACETEGLITPAQFTDSAGNSEVNIIDRQDNNLMFCPNTTNSPVPEKVNDTSTLANKPQYDPVLSPVTTRKSIKLIRNDEPEINIKKTNKLASCQSVATIVMAEKEADEADKFRSLSKSFSKIILTESAMESVKNTGTTAAEFENGFDIMNTLDTKGETSNIGAATIDLGSLLLPEKPLITNEITQTASEISDNVTVNEINDTTSESLNHSALSTTTNLENSKSTENITESIIDAKQKSRKNSSNLTAKQIPKYTCAKELVIQIEPIKIIAKKTNALHNNPKQGTGVIAAESVTRFTADPISLGSECFENLKIERIPKKHTKPKNFLDELSYKRFKRTSVLTADSDIISDLRQTITSDKFTNVEETLPRINQTETKKRLVVKLHDMKYSNQMRIAPKEAELPKNLTSFTNTKMVGNEDESGLLEYDSPVHLTAEEDVDLKGNLFYNSNNRRNEKQYFNAITYPDSVIVTESKSIVNKPAFIRKNILSSIRKPCISSIHIKKTPSRKTLKKLRKPKRNISFKKNTETYEKATNREVAEAQVSIASTEAEESEGEEPFKPSIKKLAFLVQQLKKRAI